HKVVNSSSYGAFQHNGFTWEVDGDDFDYASDVNMLATTTHKVTNDWLVKVDSAERQRFIDTLYDIIKSSNATTLAEFQSNWRQSAMSILKYSKGLDKETVKFIFQTMGQLVSSATKSTFKPKDK
ncbi:MAG: Mbeg1-like protein, partial [Clostridia bacterium]